MRYDFQDEAGSVLVGVQSVAPFEAYIDALQPRFTLTTEEALRTALATTQIQELRELRALLLSVALNLPTVSTAITEEVKRTGAETTTSRTETTSEASGTTPAVAAPTKLTETLAQLADATTSISLDASLTYRSAAALLQEVALLSSYVRDAAVSSRTAPYVVRMLLTVFPTSRRVPFDVYTNISFFGSRAPSSGPFLYNEDLSIPRDVTNKLDLDIERCSGQPVQVIPLFVTDNLETSVLRSARGAVADIGGTVGGSVGGAGLGLGGRAQREESAASLGRGLNAIFTLGLASENTLAVRLGAVSSDVSYEMVPRTYNLTALVLMPAISIKDALAFQPLVIGTEEEAKDLYSKRDEALNYIKGKASEDALLIPCSSVQFRAHSNLRHSLSGSILAVGGQERLTRELKSMSLGDQRLIEALMDDDFGEFRGAYPKTLFDAGRRPEYDWVAAVAARSRVGLAGGRFDIPRSFVQFFSSPEKIALYDDGKVASMQLSGAVGLESKGLSGALTAEGGGKTWAVYSTSATATSDGTGAKIEFPSVAQAATVLAVELKDLNVQVDIRYAPPLQRWSPASRTYRTWKQVNTPIIKIEAEPPTPPAGFTLVAKAGHIRAREGVGRLAVEIKTSSEKLSVPEIRLSVEGATLLDVVPSDREIEGDWVLATNKIYGLRLGNLLPGNTVKLRAWRLDGKKKIEVPIVPVAVYELAMPPAKGDSGQ